MKKVLQIATAVVVSALMAPAADASVLHTFGTNEPFAGGALSFTYSAPDFLNDVGFIERSALTNVVGNIARVRFEASCPSGGGAAACDQVTVIAGTTSVFRYFRNGAFAGLGNPAVAFGAAATLAVAPDAVAAVPEPRSWAMMMLGFGGIGYAMRRRARVSSRGRLA